MGSRHAIVVSYLALFVALGGSAAALQGKNSVRSDDLARNSVKTRAIAPRAITPKKVQLDSINSPIIRNGGIGTFDYRAGSVDSQAIADGGITSADLGLLDRLTFGQQASITADSGAFELRATQIQWIPTGSSSGVIATESSGDGGGGLVLNGQSGPGSGFLRFQETRGSPPLATNAATLIARDNGAGKTELVALFAGGGSQVLATQP